MAELRLSSRSVCISPQLPRAAANSASSVISRTSSGSPVRMTIAGPCGASGGSGGKGGSGAGLRSRRPGERGRQRGLALEPAVLVREVDRAPGREAGDEQLGDAVERLLARQAG